MKSNIHIVIGHYGSGKTEFAVNYAIRRRESGSEVAIADLDIVNPYFRTRQQADMLEAKGIRVVSSNLGNDWRLELPALNSELQSFFIESQRENIIDVGGNAVGARVLARFQPKIVQEDHQLICVLNANRPEVRKPDDALSYLRAIEQTTSLTCTGLVNNTHLCGETTAAEIRKGAALAEEVSRQTGIPVLCHVAEERFAPEVSDLREPVFPITIKMKKPWEL